MWSVTPPFLYKQYAPLFRGKHILWKFFDDMAFLPYKLLKSIENFEPVNL